MERKSSRLSWWIKQRLLKPWNLWHDIKWWFLHRTFDRYHVVKIRSLKPGYHDVSDRILHASFDLLAYFVERAQPFDSIDWNTNEETRHVAKEIKQLYHWWMELRPARIDKVMALPDEKCPDLLDEFKPTRGVIRVISPEYSQAIKERRAQEEAWAREDQENLIRLIKIREHLWT